MATHLVRAGTVEEFCKIKDAPTLLLSGVAEVNSNARMFGGVASDSFKIKFKRLEKYGLKICKNLFGDK